jgi:hypothetical protein
MFSCYSDSVHNFNNFSNFIQYILIKVLFNKDIYKFNKFNWSQIDNKKIVDSYRFISIIQKFYLMNNEKHIDIIKSNSKSNLNLTNIYNFITLIFINLSFYIQSFSVKIFIYIERWFIYD